MNFYKKNITKPQAHASALNDILFILLLFFLIISTLSNPNVIKLNIPKAASDTKTKQTVVVSIDSKQHFFVGSTMVNADALTRAIETEIKKSKDSNPTVVINADKEAMADNIIAVMRSAHELNVNAVLAVDNGK